MQRSSWGPELGFVGAALCVLSGVCGWLDSRAQPSAGLVAPVQFQ